MSKNSKKTAPVEVAEPVPVYQGKPNAYILSKPPKASRPASRWKGLLRRLLILSLLAAIILLPILAYYYQRYSEIIDKGLQGKIFERSSGVYAAPLSIRRDSPMRVTDLIRHLQGVGYVQRGEAEGDTRGRYTVTGNLVEIRPSSASTIDGSKPFLPLRVAFGPNGSGVQSIVATETRQDMPEAEVEPEQISATVNQQREKRKIIEYKDLPASLVNSIVVIEDRGFFEHSGISITGILRALFRNYEAGEVREGGSTITQQLVKGFFLTPERTLKRKLAEAYMSIILERKLTKEQIMGMYCNQIYLGQRGGFSINGFGEAARAYFGKDVNYLAPHESALLAGIIRSPNYYSPYSHEDRARDRRNFVLTQLAEAGKLTPVEVENAKRQPLGVIGRGGTDASDAPYFVDYVMRQLDEQYGDDSQSMRSMRIYTTVDLDLQRAAYAAVAKNMPEIDRLVAQKRGRIAGLQVAMVAMNAKNGDILAMVGGRDYAMSQLNRATDAKRQPGSVFKPFVYAAGLSEGDPERRITPAMIFRDEPRSFEFDGKYYSPGNFGDSYENRSMTVREAVAKSKNVIAVSVAERVGFQQVANFAERAGLTKVPAVPSVALGVAEATPLQMASAYTAFANQGKRVAPVPIRRITTKDGSTVFQGPTQANEVMSPQVAFLMTSIMQDVLDQGTGTRVRQIGFREIAAGKTGSSRDAWFAGYTKNLVCVVWIGFDDNADVGVTGGSTAALIWADFMIQAMQIRPDFGGAFESPSEGLVTLYVDPATGQPAQTDTPGARAELFLRGTQPGEAQDYSPPANQDRPATIDGAPVIKPLPPATAAAGSSSGIPAVTEPAKTNSTEPVSPRIDARPFLGGGSDALIPVLPEARRGVSVAGAQPVVTPTPQSSTIRSAADNLIARVSGKTKPTPTPTPAPVTKRPVPTPTPMQEGFRIKPVPVPQTSNKAQPNVIVIGKPTPDPRSTRPRVVPTPTPAPKQIAAKTLKKQAPKATKSATTKPAAIKPVQKEKVTIQPTPPPTPQPEPTTAPKSSGKQFNMEVCSVSGLIPVKGLCQTRVRRSFNVGQEPTRQCSADRHK